MITGGIHMDGFLDTVDALSSNQTMEDRLRILSDPHSGAFAIIFCGVYYILTFGFWYEIQSPAILIMAFGFVLSRSLSGFSVVSFKMAKNTGLAHIFSSSAVKKNVRIANAVMILLSAFAMVYIHPVLGIITVAGAFLTFFYYRYKAYKNFDGITGDLCGYFLQLCELVMVICVVGGQILWF
jgi:adenosylcobinamide-GDP ribazoletransferase